MIAMRKIGIWGSTLGLGGVPSIEASLPSKDNQPSESHEGQDHAQRQQGQGPLKQERLAFQAHLVPLHGATVGSQGPLQENLFRKVERSSLEGGTGKAHLELRCGERDNTNDHGNQQKKQS
jgi:hypothetical protein